MTILYEREGGAVTEGRKMRQAKRMKHVWLGVALLLVVYASYVWYARHKNEEGFAESYGAQNLEPRHPAYSVALDAVKQKLVSPSSVRVVEARMDTDIESPVVLFELDAQNEYGAMIRQRWLVDLKETARGDWRVVRVNEKSR